jgi:hypothetical protein
LRGVWRAPLPAGQTAVHSHQTSINTARKRAADAEVTDRAASSRVRADILWHRIRPHRHLRLPARRRRPALEADGTWLIVEPFVGDTLAGNLHPVGRIYCSFSIFLCVLHIPGRAERPQGRPGIAVVVCRGVIRLAAGTLRARGSGYRVRRTVRAVVKILGAVRSG